MYTLGKAETLIFLKLVLRLNFLQNIDYLYFYKGTVGIYGLENLLKCTMTLLL